MAWRKEVVSGRHLALVSIVAVALLSGCGSGSSVDASTRPTTTRATTTAAPPATTRATTTAAPPTTTAAQPPDALGKPVIVRTLRGSDPNGYKASVRVAIYALKPASEIPALPYSRRSTLSACSADPQADAVIPVAFVITNQTSDFSTPFRLLISSNNETGYSIEGDVQYGSGEGSCFNPSDPNSEDIYIYDANWSQATAPGGAVRDDFFVVVHGYRTPADPHGDPSSLRTSYGLGFNLDGGVGGDMGSVRLSRAVVPVIPGG